MRNSDNTLLPYYECNQCQHNHEFIKHYLVSPITICTDSIVKIFLNKTDCSRITFFFEKVLHFEWTFFIFINDKLFINIIFFVLIGMENDFFGYHFFDNI